MGGTRVKASMLDDVDLPSGVLWSIAVGSPWHPDVQHDGERVCATASIGKTLLLLTVAEQVSTGRLDPTQPLTRLAAEPVADSGLWQHLQTEDLSLHDTCVLVGSVSDNLATNVLVDLVGLDAVARTARTLGLTDTALWDVVRNDRGPQHPPALSTGNALELHRVCSELAEPRTFAPEVTARVTGWLTLDTDTSMVAGAFGLDPLAHVDEDRGFALWHKTGTNVGVRCDVGVVTYASRQVAWAVLANWQVTDPVDPIRDDVLSTMQEIGRAIRRELEGPESCV